MAKTNHIIQPIGVTYSQLVTLINNSGLTEGQQYRITDYQTVHYILDYGVATSDINSGSTEPLIVTANSSNIINEKAYSELYPFDIIYYDYNPSNWEDDPAFYNVTGFKGVIYFRHDTQQNVKTHFDFRNVKSRLWKIVEESTDLISDRYLAPYSTYKFRGYTLPYYGDYIAIFNADPSDYQDFYTFVEYDKVNDVEILSSKCENYTSVLPSIVFRMSYVGDGVEPYLKNIKLGTSYINVFNGYLDNVNIGNYYNNNICLHNMDNVVIGNYFELNGLFAFDDYYGTLTMEDSKIGNFCYENYIRASIERTVIGNSFENNTMIPEAFLYECNIGSGLYGNYFEKDLQEVNMGHEISGNKFGKTSYCNFGSQLYDNTFNYAYHTQFGTEIYDSIFGITNYSKFYGPMYDSTFGETYQCSFRGFFNDAIFPDMMYINYQGNGWNGIDVSSGGYGNLDFMGSNARHTTILDDFYYLDLDEIYSEWRYEHKDFSIIEDKKELELDASIVSLSGYFYNKFAFTNANFPAVGWTVPSIVDWETLTNYLITTYAEINSTNVGNYLKVNRQPNHPDGGVHNTAIQPSWAYNSENTPYDQFNFSVVPSGCLELFDMNSGPANFIGFGLGTNDRGTYGITKFASTTDRRFLQLKGNVGTALNVYIQYNHNNAHNQGYSVRLFRTATVDEQSLSDGTYVDDYIGNDGKTYKAVKIGTQVWVAENLRETQFRNGDPIPVQPDLSLWRNASTPQRVSYRNREEYAITKDWKSDLVKFTKGKKIDVSNVKNAIGTPINVSYSELVTLIDSSGLTEGQQYRITDYQTVHYIIYGGGDINSGNIEVLIATAISENEISPIVKSELYPQDLIHYDWNPVNWLADIGFSSGGVIIPNFKGVITLRHDTKNDNKLWYDFRNVKFRRWETNIVPIGQTTKFVAYDSSYEDAGYYLSTDIGTVNVPNIESYIDVLTFNGTEEQYNNLVFHNEIGKKLSGTPFYFVSILSNNVFNLSNSGKVFNNKFSIDCFDNTFSYNISDNIIDNYFRGNLIGYTFTQNKIGFGFEDNYVKYGFKSNILSEYIYYNVFGINFYENKLGSSHDSCHYNGLRFNTLGWAYSDCFIGNGNYSVFENTFGDNYDAITISECSRSKIGCNVMNTTINNMTWTSIVSNVQYCTIGELSNCVLGSGIWYCQLPKLESVTMGSNIWYVITSGTTNSYNTFGSDIWYLNIGLNFTNNIIGNGTGYSDFGDYFKNNTVENGVKWIITPNRTAGNEFRNNTLKNGVSGTSNVDRLDFSGGTHTVANYNTEIYRRPDGTIKLKYYDDSDAVVIVNHNA